MVAHTSPDCLPYFEGTDSPCLNTGTVCDPSTVWCDFAELVEVKLTEFDSIVARTATSTPIAWVETLVPALWTVGDPDIAVPFDTVRMDTDSMVNLDATPSGFVINTPGLYQIFGWVIGLTDMSGGTIEVSATITLTPTSLAYGTPSVNQLNTDFELITQDVLATPNIHMVLPLQAGQSLFMTIGGGGSAGSTVLFGQVSLGAAWMGDLP